jgi:hypothetical protein
VIDFFVIFSVLGEVDDYRRVRGEWPRDHGRCQSRLGHCRKRLVWSWRLPLCASSLPLALGVAKGTSTPCSPSQAAMPIRWWCPVWPRRLPHRVALVRRQRPVRRRGGERPWRSVTSGISGHPYDMADSHSSTGSPYHWDSSRSSDSSMVF